MTLRRALLGLVALLALTLAGAAIFLASFDANDYKDTLVARVKAATGRDLTLDGPLTLAFWPKLRLEAGPLALSNAPGFGDEPMLAARELRVAVATLPLLSKRIEMDTVVLHGVSVNLARDAEGRGNWEDLAPPGDAPRKGNGGGLAALMLGGLDVQDGRVHWQDARSGQSLTLERIEAHTGALTVGEPITLEARARVEGREPALAGEVEAAGTLRYDIDTERYTLAPFTAKATLEGAHLPGGSAALTLAAALDLDRKAGTATLRDLAFEGLGTTIKGEFAARDIEQQKPGAKARLELRGEDLARLFTAFGVAAGKQLARAADRRFDLDFAFDADGRQGTLQVDAFKGRLLGASLDGKLSAAALDTDTPRATGTLDAAGPDFPAVLAALAAFAPGTPLLTDMARSLAREDAKAFRIATGLDADLAQGRLALTRLEADLPGLQLRGTLDGREVKLGKNSGTLSGKLTLTGEDPGPLLRALGQGDMAGRVRRLSADAGLEGSLQTFTLRPLAVTARVAGPELAKPADLTLSATAARADFERGTAEFEGLGISGLGLAASAELRAEQLLTRPTYQGRVTVPAFDLRRLLTTLGKPAPDTADAKALRQVAFSTAIAGDTRGVKFDDLALTLDESHLNGAVNITAFKGPTLDFALKLDALNADRYLPPTAEGESRPVVTPDAAVAGAAGALPVRTLRTLGLKGKLDIGALTLSGAQLRELSLALDADHGLLRLDPLKASLYGGRYLGSVQLDARPKLAKLSLDSRLDKVEVGPLLADVARNDSLSGVIDLAAALEAQGGNARRTRQSLAGTGRFDFERGVFRGVDAVAILRAVEKIIECKCVVPVPKGGETAFDSLTGTLAVKGGVVRNEDLLMRGRGFTIKGRGMLANLNDKSLKYDLELAVDASRDAAGGDKLKLGGYTVPIACRGEVSKPTCLPDFGHILGDVAKSAVKQKLKDKLGGQGGEALEKLLKF